MAKQKGAVVLTGKLGGIVFYTSRYGNLARMNEPMSKEKYLKSPSTLRRRQTSNEFGYAARVGKLLRHGVRVCMPYVTSGSLNNRLTGFVTEVLQQDQTNVPGQKKIGADNVELLKGFNWIEEQPLRRTLRVPYSIALDAATGNASLEIATLVPGRDVQLEDGATHVEISLVVVGVNYAKDRHHSAVVVSEKIEVGGTSVVPVQLSVTLPDFDAEFVVAGVGVQGWLYSNGQYYQLMEGNGFEIGAAGVR